MEATWSPSQYLKFEDHRTRPAIDLLGRVNLTGTDLWITDIGCGPGNSTEILVSRFGSSGLAGLDSSAAMVGAAKKRLPDVPFEVADISSWEPEQRQDLLFANAVLQWLPNHQTLLPRLMGALTDGGTLAIQMPDNLDEPTHVCMRTAASDLRWADKLKAADAARTTILSPTDYWAVLETHASKLDIWRTTYLHPLRGLEGIVEWFKGTGLLPYLNPLDEGERSSYLERYTALLAKHYPILDDGTVLLPFPRLFIVATR